MIRFEVTFDLYNPYYEGYPGGISGILKDCTIKRVETKKRFYWPKLQRRLAHRYVVTFIATDIGSFWVWDK